MTDTQQATQVLPAPQPFADEIVDWLHEGKSLLAYCRQDGVPKRRTIYDWVERDPVFAAQFARAREAGAGVLVDLAQDVADDAAHDTISTEHGERCDTEWVQRSKLRVDTLFKRAACYCPRLYGTKVALGGDPTGVPLQVNATGPEVPPTADLLAGIKKLGALADEVLGGEASHADP